MLKKYINKKSILALLFTALIAGGSVLFTYKYIQTKEELSKFKENPQAAALQELLSSVSTHVDIPKSENPTVATITDADKLKTQPFFKRAQNGDKLIIFKEAGRTILYRPLTDRVIETLAINIQNIDEITNKNGDTLGDSDKAAAEKKQTDSAVDYSKLKNPVSITILNGTRQAGLASRISDRLDKDFDTFEVEIVSIEDSTGVYDESLVVSETNIGGLVEDEFVNYLPGQTSEMPENELRYASDIILIIGTDYLAEKE